MVTPPTFYILDADHNVVCVGDDILRWGEFFGSDTRQVAFDKIGVAEISTIFMGIDHGILPNPQHPILFETMIFGGAHDMEQWRCATWNEAVAQHKRTCKLVRSQ